MSADLSLGLIEQFAAQAPFGIWVLDGRGVSIFANRRLYRMFEMPERTAGALGINLFEESLLEAPGLQDAARRIKAGEIVDVVLRIQEPRLLKSRLPIRRVAPLALKINAYALRSEAGAIEHYVMVMEDITEAYEQREQVRRHIHDLTIFNGSRKTRVSRLTELQAEETRLVREIRARGDEPVASP